MPDLFPGFLPPSSLSLPPVSSSNFTSSLGGPSAATQFGGTLGTTDGITVTPPTFTGLGGNLPENPDFSIPQNDGMTYANPDGSLYTPYPTTGNINESVYSVPSSPVNTGWAPGLANITTNFDYSKYTSAESAASFGSAVPTVGQSIVNGLTRALPAGFKTDVQLISDFRLGTFLRRHGNLTGDQASMLDGALDFVRSDSASVSPHANFSIDYTKNFIPIIIKTQFNIDRTTDTPKPFYIVFDSTPDNISFSKSASWNPQSFYGRPEPIQIYASSGSVSFSLTGTFFSVNAIDHNDKLNLSNRLLALTTPSKYHLMPSPVEVKIGEWKHLRCIVTDVRVDYKGPWWIPIMDDVANPLTKQSSANQAINGSTERVTTPYMLPSHAPYIYEATFNFTVVSELNSVQYAEDIMKSGWNGGLGTVSSNAWTAQITSDAIQTNSTWNAMKGDNNIVSGGIIYNNTREKIDDSTWSNIEYLRSLGLAQDTSGGTNVGPMGLITSGLTASITGLINNRFGNQISRILGK